MDSTTLITFMLQHPTARKVELLGSWDNFSEPYSMDLDRRRGRDFWSGCHSFQNIICDGDEDGIHEKRSGGLRMGGTYWYFYRIDDDVEFHDPTQETTTACPLMPGQTMNVLDVPFDVERYGSHSRTASMISLLNIVKTLDPRDRYVNPKPVVAPQPSMQKEFDEATAPAGHLPAAPGADAERLYARRRPWSADDAGAEDQRYQAGDRAQRLVESAPSSAIDRTVYLHETPVAVQYQELDATQSSNEGGWGGIRVVTDGNSRLEGSRPSSGNWVAWVPDETSTTINLPSGMDTSSQWPLADGVGGVSTHPAARRVQDLRMSSIDLDNFPAPPDSRPPVGYPAYSRAARFGHRRSFSDSISSLHSVSLGSPLRYLTQSQDGTRTTGNYTIDPSTLSYVPPSFAHQDDRSATPSFSLLPEPQPYHNEANEMHMALQVLNDQYTHNRHYSPWRPELAAPVPESPETSLGASDIGSPIFSSIHGDASDTCTSHRVSELRDWPLKDNGLGQFDFQFEQRPLDVNQSFEHLSIITSNTESTTSTALPYHLPNTNPFAHNKVSSEQALSREPSQTEQLLDEFEYLGVALL